MKFLNDVNITGSGADLSCAATVTFSNLSSSSETSAVVINSSGVLSKRTLGNNAFNSTTIPTNNNQLTNGAGFVTSSGLTSISAGTLIDVDGSGSTQTINVYLSELTDMTAGITASEDEIVLLYNGSQIRKSFAEIFGSNAYNSTTIPTNTNQLTNGAGFLTSVTTEAVVAALSETEIEADESAAIRTTIGASAVLSVGDGGLTQNNFTNALKTKLDGIDASANNYTLPAASTTAIGGVKIKSTTTNSVTPATLTNTASRTYAVQLAATGGALVVNVPWTNTQNTVSDLDAVTTEANGVMIAADKEKLDALELSSATETISGTKTFSALTTISNTTDSSSATGGNGALRTVGGASIAKKLYVGSTITGSADVIAYSDKKLKENIKTLDGKKVLEMRGVSFDRVDTKKASSGVIAQEIEKVAPELVIDDGNYKGVAYGNLVGYLIEAIKDQQKQINELKYILHGRPE